ncbi:hypothetical protein KFE25_011610 [Diacronema lutheri]|uniref:Uncharacterized protein n=1 Tax=Diacronema lutheri TaxID=2081491 RepID=A0A8J5XN22_DIALT|nr:hypothetical protein KFE25_011610 [Diacronema lutheri]
MLAVAGHVRGRLLTLLCAALALGLAIGAERERSLVAAALAWLRSACTELGATLSDPMLPAGEQYVNHDAWVPDA